MQRKTENFLRDKQKKFINKDIALQKDVENAIHRAYKQQYVVRKTETNKTVKHKHRNEVFKISGAYNDVSAPTSLYVTAND